MSGQETASLDTQPNSEDQGAQETPATEETQETTNPNENGTEGSDEVIDFLADGEGEQETSTAPESYGEFNLPDDFEFSGELLDQFKEVAKKNGLSQEAAQAMVDYTVSVKTAERQQMIKTVNGWAKEASADKEIVSGKSIIKGVINTAPEPLRNLLVDSGLTNNPDFLRWCLGIGKGGSMQEQPIINGNTRPAQTKNGLDRII